MSMSYSIQPKEVKSYVAAHGFAQLFFWSAFYYLLPALSAQIVSETDWSVLHISTTFTLAFLLWAVCAPIVGLLIDLGYGARVIRIGATVGIALMIALSKTSDRWIFSVLVVLLGACMAATLYEPCFAVMLRRFKKSGTNAVASVTLIAGFATLLTFPLVIGLSAEMTWQHIVLTFAALAVLGVVMLPFEEEVAPKLSQNQEKMPLEKGPALIALSFGLVMLGHAILLFLLPMILVRANGDPSVALFALAILGPAQIGGRIAWKSFGAMLTPQNSTIIMFVCLCLPSSLLLLFGATTFVVYAALIVQGACYGVHTILRPSLAKLYLLPSHLGQGVGTIAMVGLLMMAIGPVIGGLIWTVAGLSGLMSAILMLNMLALLLGVILRETPPRRPWFDF
jgi:MFS family permease